MIMKAGSVFTEPDDCLLQNINVGLAAAQEVKII